MWTTKEEAQSNKLLLKLHKEHPIKCQQCGLRLSDKLVEMYAEDFSLKIDIVCDNCAYKMFK